MPTDERLRFLDNLRTFLIFLVVLVHAGVVYEASGLMGPYWIVDDPATSNLPGLVNVVLDLFVMPTIFFIAGFFTPRSLQRHGGWRFLKARFRRLMIPWAIAVFTLMPLYKIIYLVSRGLPQDRWTTYFHFSNGGLGMSWLWFLPVLFLFDLLYLVLARLPMPAHRLPVGWAAAGVFALSFASSVALSKLGWLGWTKTPLVDFQNERLLPYLLVFLLGALCARRGVLASGGRPTKLFVAVCATIWIPVNVYVVLLINYLLRPGHAIVSPAVDGLVFWASLHVSLLGLTYCALQSFRLFGNRHGRLGAALARGSYSVYIIHMVVLGPIALLLLGVGLPALVKYPLLAVATYVVSNLVVMAHEQLAERLRARSGVIGGGRRTTEPA